MAVPTALNSQITDSVTQTNTEVVALSPAVAMGNFYVATSDALSLAAHNATLAQQQGNIIFEASTLVGVSLLYKVGGKIAGT